MVIIPSHSRKRLVSTSDSKLTHASGALYAFGRLFFRPFSSLLLNSDSRLQQRSEIRVHIERGHSPKSLKRVDNPQNKRNRGRVFVGDPRNG